MILSKTSMTLALLLVSTSISFASVEHETAASHKTSIHGHKYNLVRDKDRPHILAALSNHPAAEKGKTVMAAFKSAPATLPTSWDIRTAIPNAATCFTPYDQGQLGSCTANAAAGALHYKNLLAQAQASIKGTTTPSYPTPSRMFIYYNERSADGGGVTQDVGASIADSILAISNYGAPSESGKTPPFGSAWPYSDITSGKNPPFTVKPSDLCYSAALADMDLDTGVASIAQDDNVVTNFKKALIANNPVLIGIDVYDSFESDAVAATGIVPMPDTSIEDILGGHGLMVVGYNTNPKAPNTFTVRNSWGTGWGDKGYCYIPYDYFTLENGLASDFWSVGKVGAKKATPVKFSVKTTTSYGQNVYVSGNTPELGCWDTAQAMLLSSQNYPTWTGSVTVPSGQTIQYKYIKKNGNKVQWLGGENLSHNHSATNENLASFTWM
ncbi:carbohydrate-binding module family 20 domain-containing protein [Candidatus Finniella inopinata]|uniref:CBM20 domain-containing protein n=1 Tax=Candidatus Finniella inopinata TaxID=1696036 RepID=A0A4Q7DHC0_9PROT|nr:carbohydrate-binding module family 20 domain-containing protein [Candidatus Finniella inopinata]RZI46102.1 hypothetical protein EQU50_03990 [Candidatus Finniella inopinata]